MGQARSLIQGPDRLPLAALGLILVVCVWQVALHTTGDGPGWGMTVEQQGPQLVVSWVQMGGFAHEVGVRPGDVVVGIQERSVGPADAPAAVQEAQTLAFQTRDGSVLTISRGLASPLTALRQVSFTFIVLACAIAGTLVFVVARDLLVAGIMLFANISASLAALGSLATPTREALPLALVYVSLIAAATGSVFLFLSFPTNRLNTRLGRRLALASGSAALLLVALYSWTAAVAPLAYEVVRRGAFAVIGIDLLVAAGLAVWNLRRVDLAGSEERRALALVAASTVIGVAPFCLLYLLPTLVGWPAPVAADVAIIPVVLVPVSLAAAILGLQYSGWRRVVQRNMLALAVWLSLLLLYAAALTSLADARFGSTLVLVAIVASTFWSAQRWLRRWLEQLVFGDIYDYRTTLEQIGHALVLLASLDEAATHLLSQLSRTIRMCWAVIRLLVDDYPPLVYRSGTVPNDWEALVDLAERDGKVRATHLWAGADDIHAVRLVAEGTRIGTLALGPKTSGAEYTPEDLALLSTLAPLASTVLRNGLLIRSLERQVVALGEREETLAALSAKLMSVQEEERRQLALDLHDDPLQRAILLARNLGGASNAVLAKRWKAEVEEIITSLRAVCSGLRPPVLDDLGLEAGLEQLANEARARSEIDVVLDLDGHRDGMAGRLERGLEVALYRVAQEGLANCLKHSQATRVGVSLWVRDAKLTLRVVDNGKGTAAQADQRPPRQQLGLEGMRERLRPWSGRVTFESAPGKGTDLTAEVDV